MKVHSVILTFFDADGSRFELRGSRLRIGGVDSELVGGYLVVVMDRHEGQAGPQTGIEPHGSEHRAAPRADAHSVPLAESIARGVFRREINRLAAAQRRTVTRGLYAGIVGIEASPGGQANGIVFVEPVNRRF